MGGGDTAMEEATFLTRFAPKVHLLHRRDEFRASKIMLDRARANPKIELLTNTVVDEVLGDVPRSRACACATRDSGAEREMAVDGVFVAIGHEPNTEVFRDWLDMDATGYIMVQDQTAHAGSRACSPAATSTTTATARRSPRPATAAWRPSTPSAGWRREGITEANRDGLVGGRSVEWAPRGARR